MRLTGIVLTLALLASVAAEAKPQRIVSTNVCADQLALLLAPGRVVSVSFNAADPAISNTAALAKGIPVNGARAEEVVLFKPDLVLGDIYTGVHAARFAEVLGVPVEIVAPGSSLAEVRQIIRDTARVLREDERGTALIAEMDARLAALKTGNDKVRALVYEPNGITSGPGTLTHDLLTAAGLTNLGPELLNGSYGAVPLELVISAAPDLLILDDAYASHESRAQAVLRHPAFRALKDRTRIAAIPSRLWLCPGPWAAEAAERLAAQKSRVVESRLKPLAERKIRE